MISLRQLADLQANRQIVSIFHAGELDAEPTFYLPTVSIDWINRRVRCSIAIDCVPEIAPRRWPLGTNFLTGTFEAIFIDLKLGALIAVETPNRAEDCRVTDWSITPKSVEIGTAAFKLVVATKNLSVGELSPISTYAIHEIGRKIIV